MSVRPDHDDQQTEAGSAGWLSNGLLLGAFAFAVPGVALSLSGAELTPPLAAVLFGLAIIGAAFVLSWAAEAAQVDISAGLAISLLALIAVLPEYAVDFVFAYRGGEDFARFGAECVPPEGGESQCALALANMTGANRILIGVGWSLVVLLAWTRWRAKRTGDRRVELEPEKSIDILFLLLATVYSFTLPLRSSLTVLDSAVLVGLFAAYMWRVSRAPAEEPDLIGPAALIGALPKRRRRLAVGGLFALAAAIILLVAEHFAEALVASGRELGISEFFLVQWLAPLASETPELLVAGLFAWRLKTSDGLGTLVSSKVNQWTLLVGSLPIVFAVASGSLDGLPIDANQRRELLLTAAQSAFAVAILINLAMSVRAAFALLGLFASQFLLEAILPSSAHPTAIIGLSGVYLALAAAILWRQRAQLPVLMRNGLRTSYRDLGSAPHGPAGARVAASGGGSDT